MSKTNPLLKNATPTTHSESEAKIFFTADELLQHVRRKYHAPADTRKSRTRYTRAHAVSPGLFVPDPEGTKLTGQNQSVDTVQTLKYGAAGKTQQFNRRVALFRADSRDVCHGNRSDEAERKELKLRDKSQTGQLHYSMTTGKNKLVTLPRSSEAKRNPQEKISDDTHNKKRRAFEENNGSKHVCFFKMSSLHSPRIQCCCCAVGVFAAMFGIFMLSAGICIVLNVTFMEVDTSGLPPDLHNENGKKVVGIILICVALACLGLSASVSIIYFTLCNRKSQDATQQQRATPVGITTGQERVRNREAVLPGQQRATSSNHVVPVHRAGMHLHSEFSKKKSYHVFRNRPALPPHQEEEADIAKSSTELNRPDELYSASSTSHGKKLKQRGRREESAESLDVQVIPSSRTPVIVVNSFHENEQLGQGDMETQLNDSVFTFEEDSVSNTYSERCEDSGGPVLHIDALNSGVANNSSVDTDGVATLRYIDLSKSDLKSHPEFLHNISIQPELSSTSSTLVSSSCPSLSELQQHVVVVKPAKGSSPGTEAHVLGTAEESGFEEDRDSFSRLSAISNHHDSHTVLHDDSKAGFSGLHVNSAFSFDGCDPPQSEVV